MSVTRLFRIVVVWAALLCAAPAPAPAQTPAASRDAVVRGRVVATDTGEALRNARVVLVSDHSAAAVLTDAEGRFSIATPAGHREIAVSKTGYATAVVAPLADGGEVRLARGAVITGRVTDERGVQLPMSLGLMWTKPCLSAPATWRWAWPAGIAPTVAARC